MEPLNTCEIISFEVFACSASSFIICENVNGSFNERGGVEGRIGCLPLFRTIFVVKKNEQSSMKNDGAIV